MAKQIETKAEMLDRIAELLQYLIHEERDEILDWEDISGGEDELLVTLHNGTTLFIKLSDPLEAK